jgi:hypothetical protein
MQKFEWSPELWIRDSNLDQGSVSGDGSLTFSDIVKIVNQTIMETDKIVPTVTNLADRQRFIEAKRNLVNAAARFVTVGESRNHKAIVERIF